MRHRGLLLLFDFLGLPHLESGTGGYLRAVPLVGYEAIRYLAQRIVLVGPGRKPDMPVML